MNLLVQLLRPFLRLAVKFVKEQEAMILKKGRALTSTQRADATRAGVKHPERIRIRGDFYTEDYLALFSGGQKILIRQSEKLLQKKK